MKREYDIEIEGLTKYFQTPGGGKLLVLDNIDLYIEKGKFVCIIGPSGCGKSTLLNIINGLEKPSSVKKLLIAGKDYRHNPEVRRLMCYVFQHPRLLNWRTLKENVIFGLEAMRVQPKEKWEELAEEYLKKVGLGDFMDYYPLKVSGGMQQRAAIARAWANEPKILLMDEPFSHLDEFTATDLRNELIRLWMQEEKRKTIVFVTHDIREATILADEVVMLTRRPARVFYHEIIDLPRPRNPGDPEVFKLSTKLLEIFYKGAVR